MTRVAVIFGGAGFIGRHMAVHLLESNRVEHVVAADIAPLETSKLTDGMQTLLDSGRWEQVHVDVRAPIQLDAGQEVVEIYNFAAVHREPGHEPHEYWATNIAGAEHVCDWAASVGCDTIVFTSSISPYGPSETSKHEGSVPAPETAYGGSKLVAEKIHQLWQQVAPAERHLVIVRPGVVFGPGEGGNVSRLIKAVLNRYFVMLGNDHVRKAGTYVKELCHAITWVRDEQGAWGETFTLFNMTMNPAPSIQDYVKTVCKVENVTRKIPRLPFGLVYLISHVVYLPFKWLTGKDTFHPVRVKKLVRSNNIEPRLLSERGYRYAFDLEGALRDWHEDMPSEW